MNMRRTMSVQEALKMLQDMSEGESYGGEITNPSFSPDSSSSEEECEPPPPCKKE